MSRRRPTTAAVFLASAALAVAGCGDDGGSDKSASEESDQARLVAEQFKNFWGTGQGEKACALMTEEEQQNQARVVPGGTCPARTTQYDKLYQRIKEPSPETLEISGVVLTEPIAQVTLQEKEEPPKRSITLEKGDDGEWRVVAFTF